MRNAVQAPRNSWLGQVMQNRFVALVLAMIVVVPFIAVPADSHLGGIAALVLQSFALMLGVALLWRARVDIRGEQVKTFLKTGPNAPVLLLMGLLAVSCLFAPNKLYGAQELMRWGAGILLFFVVAYQFRQSKHLFLLVDAVLFLGIATSILALGQYAIDPASRGTMLFGNQQLLGSFLMILLPIAAVVALSEKASSEKTSMRQLVAQFATVLMAGCLLLAQARSAWMGALVGGLVLGGLMVMTSAKAGSLRAQKHKLVLPGMLVAVAIAFFALVGSQDNGVADRASTFSNVSGVGSWQARLHQWQGTLSMISERPLFGWGTGQYSVAQRQFTHVGEQLSTNGVTGFRTSLAEQAHNFYLQTAAELGVFGVALMVAVLAMFFVAGARRVTSMDAGIRRSLLMASMAGVAAFAVDAISSPSWQTGQVSIFFWLVLGVGVACLRPRSRQAEEVAPVLAVAPRVLRPIAVVAAVLAAIMVVLPASGVAVAADYNKDGDDSNLTTVALVTTAVAGVMYFTQGDGTTVEGADEKDKS